MKTGELRIVATESLLLLSAFSLLSAVDTASLSDSSRPDSVARFLPDHFFRELLPAVTLCVALYWALHFLRLGQAAFWLMAMLVVLPQGMAILSHNLIEWHRFLAIDLGVGDDRSALGDAALFLASLVGSVALYRTIGLRHLDRHMLSRGIDRADVDRTVLFEGIMLMGLVAAALLATLLMMALSAVLGRFDGILEGSSWSVVTIGGGATDLLALSLVLWFRGRQG